MILFVLLPTQICDAEQNSDGAAAEWRAPVDVGVVAESAEAYRQRLGVDSASTREVEELGDDDQPAPG